MVPVTGTITFAGAPPPIPGSITFLPREMAEGMGVRPAWAQFETDGKYEARAFSKEAGIVPGTYEVRIECWKTMPNEATGNPGQSYVPKSFTAELIVPAGSREPIVANFDIPKAN